MPETNIQASMVLKAANDPLGLQPADDASAKERCTMALRGLAVLLARAHVCDIAERKPANQLWAPAASAR